MPKASNSRTNGASVGPFTATGAAQDCAHGLVTDPSFALVCVDQGDNGAGAVGTLCPTSAVNSHDATNVNVTVTAGAVFHLAVFV